ncbi:MAG: LysR substrate-binding domain-containing protein [Desulfobacter sp.]
MQKTIRHLPSLNALRAFESAARHLSFTKAAEELYVTQGAVSRLVKQLETELQVKLFHRLHRQLALTDPGRLLLAPLTDAFDTMNAALGRLKKHPMDLKLKVHPSFAIRWLIPRLHRFQRAHPRIQVQLTTSSVNVDFGRENFDMGIIYLDAGSSDKKKSRLGAGRMKIVEEVLTPVCSPALLSKATPLETPGDLANHLLLHNNPEQKEWRLWSRSAGVKGLPFDRGQIFEVDDAALQAAASGLGVALGNINLIKGDLDTGMLVEPFAGRDGMLVNCGVYYLAWPDAGRPSAGVSAFITWLESEI